MRDRSEIYRDILTRARRRRETAGLKADRATEAIEEHHLGTIPPLLSSIDERRHRHYLDVDRPRYQRAFRLRDGADEFAALWGELEEIADAHRPPGTVEPRYAIPIGPMQLDYRHAKVVKPPTRS